MKFLTPVVLEDNVFLKVNENTVRLDVILSKIEKELECLRCEVRAIKGNKLERL